MREEDEPCKQTYSQGYTIKLAHLAWFYMALAIIIVVLRGLVWYGYIKF